MPAWTLSWQHRQLDLAALWNRHLDGRGITVALIDTGMLAVRGLDDARYEYLDAHGQPIPPSDADGHGTHSASVIASYASGMLGIAPAAKLISIQAVGGARSAADIEAAFAYVRDRDDIDVVSCSFVIPRLSATLRGLIHDVAAAGRILVSAAGDDDEDDDEFPEQATESCTVAAVDQRLQPLPSAKRGSWIDIAAPGVQLPIVRQNGQLGYFSDSSAAAAVVSGVAALLLGSVAAGARRRVGARFLELVKRTAQPLPHADALAVGSGLIQPQALIAAAQALR